MLSDNITGPERRRLDAVQTSARIHVAAKSYDVAEIITDAGRILRHVKAGTKGNARAMRRRSEGIAIASRIEIAGKRSSVSNVIATADLIDAFVTEAER